MFSGYLIHLLNEGIDLSLPVKESVKRAFHVPEPTFEPFKVGNFIGSVLEGGSANCYISNYCAHAHGTHTESVGHILPEAVHVREVLKKPYMFCALISLTPEKVNEDYIITASAMSQALEQPYIKDGFHLWAHEPLEALIVRTLPPLKLTDFSGSNPPYFEADALSIIRKAGFIHLLTDLPSVDREEDGGMMLAHKAFWGVPDQPDFKATITELIQVPEKVNDGIYLLGLHVANIDGDAAPSRPRLSYIR